MEQKAIQGDPTNRSFLASLLDPSAEQQQAGEDDLIAFRTDKEFRILLGLPEISPTPAP